MYELVSIAKSAMLSSIQDIQDIVELLEKSPNPVQMSLEQKRLFEAALRNAKQRMLENKTASIDHEGVDLIDKEKIIRCYNQKIDGLQKLIDQCK